MRVLSFQSKTVSVDVQVVEVAGGVSLRGLVYGASGAALVQTSQERHKADIDQDGWFTPGGTAVTTAWTTTWTTV